MTLSYSLQRSHLVPPSPSPLASVRLSATERGMLEAAAAQARTCLSDFVRRRALDAAEQELLAHPPVTIPAADWEKFEAWEDTPAKLVQALQKLAATKSAWRD